MGVFGTWVAMFIDWFVRGGLYIANQEEKTEDGAIAKRIITREAEERIIDYAFQYAKVY